MARSSGRGPTPKKGKARKRSASVSGDLTVPIAGVVVRRGKYMEVEPLFQKGPTHLVARDGARPQPGDLVLYEHSHGRRARVEQIIGKKGRLQDVMEALFLDNLVQRGFSRSVLAEASEVGGLEKRRDYFRPDLRDLFTFTVDPAEARDFDDALSFESSEDGIVVYVHIADVSYYVTEEGVLDAEALRRGTSVYVPTGVEPMLPPVLSHGVCSLSPEEDRKTVTVEMLVGGDGEVRETHFYRSLIRSDLRMNYDELQDIFDGRSQAPGELGRSLEIARPLAQRIRERRFEQGSLRISSADPDFHWDREGRLVDAHPVEEMESHHFIEEYMILANTQVARFLEHERVPTVYRVHDLPDPFALDRLLDTLASLDVPTPSFDPLTATARETRRVMRETAEWVDRFAPSSKGRDALIQQVLRTQSRAIYSTENVGHFGLALGTYCHFTSPIRRYPDLLVHRALLAQLGVGPTPTTSTLSEWAEHCSRMEREASKVELTGEDIALAHLLQDRLHEAGGELEFEGQIVGFVGAGAFVRFDRLYEGFLPARDLPGDYFELDDSETALVGRHGGRAYRLADVLPIRVSAVDAARGKIDLVLAAE